MPTRNVARAFVTSKAGSGTVKFTIPGGMSASTDVPRRPGVVRSAMTGLTLRSAAVCGLFAALCLCEPLAAHLHSPALKPLQNQPQAPSVEAVRLAVAAPDRGDATAQVGLGVLYAEGLGVPSDDVEAVRWYRLAADQGNAYGQANLGFMYETGRGVTQDHVKATRLYRLAADQGYAGAQYNLGAMYATGQGVPQDAMEAVRWYRLAADQGDAYAQNNLGVMYSEGRGVPQDDAEAARWYRLTAD